MSSLEKRYACYYRCPACGIRWVDSWPAICEDRCPECRALCTPYDSKRLVNRQAALRKSGLKSGQMFIPFI